MIFGHLRLLTKYLTETGLLKIHLIEINAIKRITSTAEISFIICITIFTSHLISSFLESFTSRLLLSFQYSETL